MVLELKQKILEFLNRNLILEDDIINQIRESINDLSKEQLEGVYEVLLDLDKKQTSTLQEKLKENPYFFFEMEIKVSKEIYEKHLKLEKEEKRLIEEWLLRELSKY